MGALRSDGPRREPSPRTDQPDLVDASLLDDIELLGAVIASVTDFPHHLTPEEVDSVLGLGPALGPAAADGGPDGRPPTPAAPCSATDCSAGHRAGGAGPEVMADLFRPEPEPWSARGAHHPHRNVWTSMLTRLGAERVPSSRRAVEGMLAEAFHAVVGVDLRSEPLSEASRRVYWMHVDLDEMSSGVVDVEDWKHRLLPLLLSRVGRIGVPER